MPQTDPWKIQITKMNPKRQLKWLLSTKVLELKNGNLIKKSPSQRLLLANSIKHKKKKKKYTQLYKKRFLENKRSNPQHKADINQASNPDITRKGKYISVGSWGSHEILNKI